MKKLYRSVDDRKLAGVCGGLGEYFNIDSTIIRLAVVVAGLFSLGVILFVYIVAALIIPNRIDVRYMRLIISWITYILFNAIVLFGVAQLFIFFYLIKFGTILFESVIIFNLNVFIIAIIVIFTLASKVLTFCLFLFVNNAIMLMITQAVMSSDFVINNFGVAIIASIIISIINAILSSLVSNK